VALQSKDNTSLKQRIVLIGRLALDQLIIVLVGSVVIAQAQIRIAQTCNHVMTYIFIYRTSLDSQKAFKIFSCHTKAVIAERRISQYIICIIVYFSVSCGRSEEHTSELQS